MYLIKKVNHEIYGPIIMIERTEGSLTLTPQQVVQQAIKDCKEWQPSQKRVVKFLIDDQVMTTKQAEHWGYMEYHSLPKCGWCKKILNADVQTNQAGEELFCSYECSDKDYGKRMEKEDDEYDADF